MQILIDVPESQVSAVMEFLHSVPDVKMQPKNRQDKTQDDFDAPMEGYWDGRENERPPFVIGCLEGQGWMADDFDAPMEELQEYRE
ncbi:MAG: DUF2281 domain-containing protein [Planctomycetaceae bacterium]|jgi:hypothetical protein|nr:DUF2281 domain-containing protein [Planctomycetaceae bacterium]